MSTVWTILSILVIVLEVHPTSAETGDAQYFQGTHGACSWVNIQVNFGGNNYDGTAGKVMGDPYPAIFTCPIQEGEAKYLKLTFNKKTGISFFHSGDSAEFFMGQGQQCDKGKTFQKDDFKQEQRLGEVLKDGQSFATNNIKLTDTLSNPDDMKVCVILYCMNPSLNCEGGTATVQFYDLWSKPTPIVPLGLGLGAGDWVTLILFLMETISIFTLCCGFYFKYSRVYEKLYGDNKLSKFLKEQKASAGKKLKKGKKDKKKKGKH